MRESILNGITECNTSSLEARHTKEAVTFGADFSLELVGIKTGVSHYLAELEPLRQGNKDNDRLLTSLFSSLRQAESLTFIYDGGHQQLFRWRIVGKATSSSSSADAEARLYNVRHAVMTALESRKSSYCFDLAAATTKSNRTYSSAMKWMGVITPASTVVSKASAAIGFSHENHHDKSPAISSLPHYLTAPTNGFQSVASLLNASPIPIRIDITIEPTRLDRRQLTALDESINIIRNSDSGDHLPAHLEETAQIWKKVQAGYRIRCATYSAQPVPESYLLMLGGEIFHGPVSVSCKKQSNIRRLSQRLRPIERQVGPEDGVKPVALDLHDCIPTAVSLPVLIPSPAFLLEAGINRVYNKSTLTLPIDGLRLGHIHEGNTDRDVFLCDEERPKHLLILGGTGVGKSTLEKSLLQEDIWRGAGACAFDFHGDWYKEILDSIPAHRAKDVILLDATNRDRAVGINLFELDGPNRDLKAGFVVNELLNIVGRLFDLRSTGGPVFEVFFKNAASLLFSSNRATLTDLSVVFEHPKIRAALIGLSENRLLQDFWKMAENVNGDHALKNMGPYITSKVNFANSAQLRPILGQERSTINFRDIMDTRKILLVNLSRGVLGELESQLLGMVLLTKLLSSAMERIDTPVNKRSPFNIYVDECQNVANDTIGTFLSEARKFGISLTLGCQHLNQLTNQYGKYNIVDSVLGNVGGMIFFRLGAIDAEKLATYTKPDFTAADLQSLPNYFAAARLMTPNGPTSPFVFETYPSNERKASARTLAIIKKNQLKYTTPIIEVEAAIQDRRKYYEQMGVVHEARIAKESKMKDSETGGVKENGKMRLPRIDGHCVRSYKS